MSEQISLFGHPIDSILILSNDPSICKQQMPKVY